MSDDQRVSFEEQYPSMQSNLASQQKEVSGMAAWLIKKGIAKSASQANLILFGTIVVGLGGAIYFVFF